MENVFQLIKRTLSLRQLCLVQPSSDGVLNSSFNSYGSEVIKSSQFENIDS